MSRHADKQKRPVGFRHAVSVGVVVVAFTVIGFIGYKLYANPLYGDGVGRGPAGLLGQGQPSGELDASAAPTIRSSTDLDKASAVLDQVDTNAEGASEMSQLSTQLNSFAN